MYDGIGVPESLEFELTWKMDSKLNDTSRVYYIPPEDKKRQETKIVTIFKERNECFTTFAYLIVSLEFHLGYFHAPALIDQGHIVFGSSVCLLVCLQKLLHWP